jgi:glycosyltransferase involved in cell wall biosynthesis
MRATIPSKTQVALACGRPVLLAAAGDAADLITGAGAGVVVAPGDAEALAAAMRRMAQMSPVELRGMGSRGRAYYDEFLSLGVGVEKTDAVFRAASRVKHRA